MNRIKHESIFKCVPGQIIAQDIFDPKGVHLVAKGVRINEFILSRLVDLGITHIPVHEDSPRGDKKGNTTALLIEKSYKKDVATYKGIINDLASGKRFDIEQLDLLKGSIGNKITHSHLLIESFTQLEDKDEYTYTHSVNVAFYGMLIAKWMGLSQKQIDDIIQVGILHDLGKIKIPDSILNKEGSLKPEEFKIMKRHATFSYEIIKNVGEINDYIKQAVLMHHEREDGKGYPLGVTGDKINLYAKIISVADVYGALTSERVYKKRSTPFNTFKEFYENPNEYGHFSADVVMIFLKNIANYYEGSMVRMNTGQVGKIAFIPPNNISNPIVFVDDNFIDLSKERGYQIAEVI
jgi:putative nucleotidyltransferase with HDIG domain